MPVILPQEIIVEVIRRALLGQDHRDVVVDKIDEAFVEGVLDFFEKVVNAKIRKEDINLDWYKEHFLNKNLDKSVIAWNSGLNIKTINNKRGTTRKEVIIEESLNHFDRLVELIDSLTDEDMDIDLSITMGSVTVHLTLNESLVVINALAVRRAAIRGGTWSTVGKQVEGPLMETLCRLFMIDEKHFTRALDNDGSFREVDYYLLPPSSGEVRCEVKLMGKGNPESADVTLARDSKVLVASTMSDTNKTQMNERGVLWTELQTQNGFLRFGETLKELGIPYTELPNKDDYALEIEQVIEGTFVAE